MIASENFVSEAVLEAAGSIFTNKYAEGYPAVAIMAAANTPTWWRTWRAIVPSSFLALLMRMFSRTRVRRRMRRLMLLFCRLGTRSWASILRMAAI